MTIKGPVSENFTLDVKRYTGCKDIDLEAVISDVAEKVQQAMEEQAGMLVSVSRDEYKVGGGLLSAGTVSPALVFTSRQHPDYAGVFVSFKHTGAILELLVAQKGATTRNYQKVTQGKLFADKAAFEEEDLFYSMLAQFVFEAIDL